jgi:hypothetical protein
MPDSIGGSTGKEELPTSMTMHNVGFHLAEEPLEGDGTVSDLHLGTLSHPLSQ